ncbi:MAG: CAP domain-containing protein [Candidatus Dormibacteria bacterium]
MSRLARAGAAALVACVLGLGTTITYAFDAPTEEGQLFADTNQDRTSNGVAALGYDTTLASIARDAPYSGCGFGIRGRSQDMVDRNYFSHTIPNCGGQMVFDILNARGIGYLKAGENIGWTDADDSTSASYINDRFMNSPEHRANILDPAYTQAGMGAAKGNAGFTCCGGANGTMFSEVFLQPQGAPPPPPPRNRPSPSSGVHAASPVPRNSPVPAIEITPEVQATPHAAPTPSPAPSPVAPAVEVSSAGGDQPGLVELIVDSILRTFLNV